MRRLIFVNRFFFPDHSATSQILSDLAFHLASTGREVHVVTSRQLYDAPQASLPIYQTINGVQVHRVSSTSFGRNALLGRSLDYLSFYRSLSGKLTELARPSDLLIAETDPPLVSVVAAAAAHRKGAGLINWLQDLYPELAAALSVPFMRGPIAGRLTQLRNRSLRAAEANVVVGELMAQKIKILEGRPARIHVIPNWCDDFQIRPLAQAENPLRQTWDLEGKFVFGYSGNLGRVHEFDTVLTTAECLREEERVVFLMIGGGKRFDQLRNAARARGLTRSFRFMPYQDRQMLRFSLGVSDAHWLSLHPKLEGLIVPSKFYGIAAAGRPIVVIGAKDGELARLVCEHDCGIAVETGDVDTLCNSLLRLCAAPETAAAMGIRARNMLEAHFARRQALGRWDALLDGLDARRAPAA
jgi:glycosyltransferase involved in cell wall biosynthesis